MIIISHRGYWESKNEKNTISSFKRSFSNGFGTETDIRDYLGRLVISHDIANDECISVESFFKVYNRYDNTLPLALNIKSDGLQRELTALIKKYRIKNYFVFDMSIPDTLIYFDLHFNVFTRQSEYEPEPAFYSQAHGIWLDEFHGSWIKRDTIREHMNNHKKVCIVSPELHGIQYTERWVDFKKIQMEFPNNKIILCTDYPQKAKLFFND